MFLNYEPKHLGKLSPREFCFQITQRGWSGLLIAGVAAVVIGMGVDRFLLVRDNASDSDWIYQAVMRVSVLPVACLVVMWWVCEQPVCRDAKLQRRLQFIIALTVVYFEVGCTAFSLSIWLNQGWGSGIDDQAIYGSLLLTTIYGFLLRFPGGYTLSRSFVMALAAGITLILVRLTVGVCLWGCGIL